MNFWKAALTGALIMNLVGCGGDSAPSAFTLPDGSLTMGVIYGEDSILDIGHHDRNTRANVALVRADKWAEIMKGEASWTVNEIYGTGPELAWGEQESKAFCSGTLVAPEMVLTAGHCFTGEHTCENTVFVFNDQVKADGASTRIGVQCRQIVAQKNDFASGMDYALVQISIADNIEPVLVSKANPAAGDLVYSIGYPLGSLKKTAEGKIRKINPENEVLETNLDVFFGNSGSPVFDAKTHELVGVLHGGEDDFQEETNEDGYVLIKKCEQDDCRGEFVIPIQKILADIEKQK